MILNFPYIPSYVFGLIYVLHIFAARQQFAFLFP